MHGKINKREPWNCMNEIERKKTREGEGEKSCFSTFDNACQTQLK